MRRAPNPHPKGAWSSLAGVRLCLLALPDRFQSSCSFQESSPFLLLQLLQELDYQALGMPQIFACLKQQTLSAQGLWVQPCSPPSPAGTALSVCFKVTVTPVGWGHPLCPARGVLAPLRGLWHRDEEGSTSGLSFPWSQSSCGLVGAKILSLAELVELSENNKRLCLVLGSAAAEGQMPKV